MLPAPVEENHTIQIIADLDNQGDQDDLMSQIAQLQSELKEQVELYQDQTNVLYEAREDLQSALNRKEELKKELVRKREELESCLADLVDVRDQMQKSLLPEQNVLLHIWHKLQNLPPTVKEIAVLYYNLNELSVFLTQCGQFALLRECWQSCVKKVLGGAKTEGMAEFLELALQIYNKAFPDSPCKIITAKPQSAFNITEQDRMGPMGNYVSKIVLPGLIKPNGEIACKCLVELA